MIYYPDFTKLFYLFLDASDKQLGTHVAQVVANNRSKTKAPILSKLEEICEVPKGFYCAPILFYSRKLNHY